MRYPTHESLTGVGLGDILWNLNYLCAMIYPHCNGVTTYIIMYKWLFYQENPLLFHKEKIEIRKVLSRDVAEKQTWEENTRTADKKASLMGKTMLLNGRCSVTSDIVAAGIHHITEYVPIIMWMLYCICCSFGNGPLRPCPIKGYFTGTETLTYVPVKQHWRIS